MKINFCTLFNSAYLSRGLVLYNSLKQHCADFHLYVFAFDKETLEYFRIAGFTDLTVISLEEFEDSQLLAVKPTRTNTEYCWTCTASTILYAIERFELESCTYIDADMCFYADPALLFDEWGSDSVIITEHRYSPAYDQSLVSGRYCVQFVAFRNDERGMKVLREWRNDTINWCYARVEEGKFGDQKYLDSWTTLYSGVHVLNHPGGGVAPWNVQQYDIAIRDRRHVITERTSGKEFPLVFFHFHGLKFFQNAVVLLTGTLYEVSAEQKRILFIPYLKKLLAAGTEINKVMSGLEVHGNSGISPKHPMNLFLMLAYYINDLRYSWKNINGKSIRERLLHHHYYSLKSLTKEY